MRPRVGPRVWTRILDDVDIRDEDACQSFRSFARAWLDRRAELGRAPTQSQLAQSLPHWDAADQSWSAPTLNHLLNDKRAYPRNFVERAEVVAHAILADPRERALLVALARRDCATGAARERREEELGVCRAALRVLPATWDHFTRVLPHWHRLVVLEMAACEGFREDPEWIAERLGSQVTPAEAYQALEALIDTGLLVRDDAGALQRPSELAQLHTDRHAELDRNPDMENVRSRGLVRFYRAMLEPVEPSLTLLTAADRSVMGTLLHIPRGRFSELGERMAHFAHEVGVWSDAVDQPADTVIQLGVFAYPAAVTDAETVPEWFAYFRDRGALDDTDGD